MAKKFGGLLYCVPSLVSALREMPHGFDVEVTVMPREHVCLRRPGVRDVIVPAVGWCYMFPVAGADSAHVLTTEYVPYIVRSLMQVEGIVIDVDAVLASMSPFWVHPLAVPLSTAVKFSRESEFFVKWRRHHVGLGGAYSNL
jgi:hypothetical protein